MKPYWKRRWFQLFASIAGVPPALSFGYFGNISRCGDLHSRARFSSPLDVGGGIVFHGDEPHLLDVIPASDPVFDESSIAIYEKIHRALCGALG